MKKIFTVFILVCLVMLSAVSIVNARGTNGIYGNGTWGLYIDIYGPYYTKSRSITGYEAGSCTWYVASRMAELSNGELDRYTVYGTGDSSNSLLANAPSVFGLQTSWTLGLSGEAAFPTTGKAVWVKSGHVSIIEEVRGNEVLVSEGGHTSYPNNDYCAIKVYSKSEVIASSIGYVYFDYTPTGTLDINGLLDGSNVGGLTVYGTVDVYVDLKDGNGYVKVADDVSDFVQTYPAGTAYRVNDIKANPGYTYAGGSASYSGTITSGVISDVRLAFNTIKPTGITLNKTSASITNGSTLQLTATITPSDAKDKTVTWTSSNASVASVSSSGKVTAKAVGTATITATAKGNTSVKATCKITVTGKVCEFTTSWLETNIPCSNASASLVDIQYNNHYQTVAASSPGSGWTKSGSGTTKYDPTGEVRESPYPLSTSNTLTRAEEKDYYYHYCRQGSSEVNYEYGPNFTTKHTAGAIGDFTIEGSGKDGDLTWYQLRHKGRFGNALAMCDFGSNYVYYRMYVYDVRKAVTYYTWTRDSGWTGSMDSSAASVSYRYRLKSGVPTGITLNYTARLVEIGKTLELTATVTPSNAENKNVTWSSSNTNIATVSASGVVTAKAAGKATITATAAGNTSVKAACEITCGRRLDLNGYLDGANQSTLLDYGTVDAYIGGTKRADDKADFYWIVEVGQTYQFTDIKVNPGYSYDGVYSGPISGTMQDENLVVRLIFNTIRPTAVTLNKTSMTLAPGAASTLTAAVSPSDAKDKSVIWTSSNTSVATVSSGGVVTAKAVGSAVITAAAAGDPSVKATCKVTVSKPSSCIPGDINGDGVVNGNDLFRLRRWFVDKTVTLSCSADLNGDGVVNGNDLFRLRRWFVDKTVVLH